MSPEVAATLRVLIDGQAVMYADLVGLQSKAPLSEDDHLQLQEEWKAETAQLITQLLTRGIDEERVHPVF